MKFLRPIISSIFHEYNIPWARIYYEIIIKLEEEINIISTKRKGITSIRKITISTPPAAFINVKQDTNHNQPKHLKT